MQSLTVAMGIAAVLLHGLAFVLYSVNVKLGHSRPNAVCWSIWTFLAVINAFSYREMSGDFVSTLQFFAGSAGCTLTFLYVLAIGKFSRPSSKEGLCFLLGLLAVLVWWNLRSAAGANMIILAAFVISFAPTLWGVRKDPFKESHVPWSMWTLASALTAANVLLREVNLLGLAAPAILAVTHGSITFLSSPGRKARFASKP